MRSLRFGITFLFFSSLLVFQPLTFSPSNLPSSNQAFAQSTEDQMIFKDPKITDSIGNTASAIKVGTQYQMTATASNPENIEQDFTYRVIISKQGETFLVQDAWITGHLMPGQSFSPAMSFIPKESGIYVATLYLLDNTESQNNLASPLSFSFTTGDSSIISILSNPNVALAPSFAITEFYNVNIFENKDINRYLSKPKTINQDSKISFDSQKNSIVTLSIEDRLKNDFNDNDNFDLITQFEIDENGIKSIKVIQLGGDKIELERKGKTIMKIPNAGDIPVGKNLSSKIKENPQGVESRQLLNSAVQNYLENQLDLFNKNENKFFQSFVVLEDSIPDYYAQKVHGINDQYITILGFEDPKSWDTIDYTDVFLELSHTKNKVNSVRGASMGDNLVEVFINEKKTGSLTKASAIPIEEKSETSTDPIEEKSETSTDPIEEKEPTYSVSYIIDHNLPSSQSEIPGLSYGPPRPVGVMEDPEGNLDEFVANEVIFIPKSDQDLKEFLEKYGGEIIRDGVPHPIDGFERPPGYQPESSGVYLIRVDLEKSSLDDFQKNMENTGFSGKFSFSSEDAAKLISLLARERENHNLNPNPLLLGNSVLEHPDKGGGNIDFEEMPWMTEDDDITIPEDQGLSVGVKHAWEYLKYHCVPPCETGEWYPPRIAIIDSGFWLDEETGMPLGGNTDYRYYSRPYQADLVDYSPSAGGESRTKCGGGSECSWHGQGAFGVSSAIQNNLYGGAGTGGPVAYPILVKVDWTWYGAVEGMYNLADAIRASAILTDSTRADVISISINGGCYSACKISELGGVEDFEDYMQRTLKTAIAFYAVVVASAGNASSNLDLGALDSDFTGKSIPCELDYVICVGAVDEKGNKVDYSNYGSRVDIFAPTNIHTTTTPDTISKDNGLGYKALEYFTGTSASTPFVAGIVALMKALDKDIYWDEVQDILQRTANPSNDHTVPTGYIDAYKAVREVKPNQPPQIRSVTPLDGSTVPYTGFDLRASVFDPEPGAKLFLDDFQIFYTANGIPIICSDSGRYFDEQRQRIEFFCNIEKGGINLSLGSQDIHVRVVDPHEGEATTTIRLLVENTSPQIKITYPNNGDSFSKGQPINFRGWVSDPDEIKLDNNKIKWYENGINQIGVGKDIWYSFDETGSIQIVFRYTDETGDLVEDGIFVNVVSNNSPSVRIIIPENLEQFAAGANITFNGIATDSEDGTISDNSLMWSSDIDGFLGYENTITAKLSGGECPNESVVVHEITLQADDSDGNRSTHSIKVAVGKIC